LRPFQSAGDPACRQQSQLREEDLQLTQQLDLASSIHPSIHPSAQTNGSFAAVKKLNPTPAACLSPSGAPYSRKQNDFQMYHFFNI